MHRFHFDEQNGFQLSGMLPRRQLDRVKPVGHALHDDAPDADPIADKCVADRLDSHAACIRHLQAAEPV